MSQSFSDLGLRPDLLEGVRRLGFESPSPVQAKTIPLALEGRDVVGLSQTGSGKTAAFVLPALQALDPGLKATQALVLCPTRELAVQVCEEVHRLAAGAGGLHALAVYGGAAMDRQVRALRQGAQLVVGTPGRVMDHLRRGTLDPGSIRFCVLDEADRMLDMGFREDMEVILDALPTDRQTLFFSATMNAGIDALIRAFSRDATRVEIERRALTVDTVEQSCYEVRSRSKIEVLSRLLDLEAAPRGIVFCNTKRMVDEACEALCLRGYLADKLHGDIPQGTRERVIRKFRSGAVELLVATDVAARGLDIDDVSIVFNYDLPYDPEDYVHRIGRTGRAGRSGKSVTFVYGKEVHRLEAIERYTRQVIRRARIPTQEEVEGRRTDKVFEAVRERLEDGRFKSRELLFDRLLEAGHTPTDVTSALFELLQEQEKRESESIAEDRNPENVPRAPIARGPKHKGKKKKGKSRPDQATGRPKHKRKAKPPPEGTDPVEKRRFKRPR